MRIIFVGMHNKEGLTPLDSKSKSGKLIDRIINEFPSYDCIKTNLYDDYGMPAKRDKQNLSLEWWQKLNPLKVDILVLLGKEVQRNMYYYFSREVHLKHPGARCLRSHESMNEYVEKAVESIKNITTNKTS